MKSDKKKTAEAEIAEATKNSNKNLYAILGVILIAALAIGGYWWYKQPKKFDVSTQPIGNAQSPTEAYKMLYAAVKSKNTEKIKLMMSENSIAFAGFVAGQRNISVEEVLKNGFTETTFSETLPPMRDERIKDGFGALEVLNTKKSWEDLPFILDATLTVEAVGNNRDGVVAVLTEDVKIPADKIDEFLRQLPQTINGLSNVQAEELKKKFTEAGATASVKTNGWKLAIGDMFKGTYQRPGLGQDIREREAANAVNNNLIPANPNVNVNNANVQMIIPKNGNAVNKVVPNVVRPNNATNGNR